jgi:hypothetical protein
MSELAGATRRPHAPATAIFVDAGWLLAAAALDLLGTPRRDELDCDYGGLIDAIGERVDRHSGGAPRLRTYWYDSALGGTSTDEHDHIAAFPYVKVRLGRLNRRRQHTGLGGLIQRDLLTLARERAIARAYLVAGAEDLLDGVAEAQKLGVQVILVGMPIPGGPNQSVRLVRECDEYVILERESFQPYFSRRGVDAAGTEPADGVAARSAGAAFARGWEQRASMAELREVLDGHPTLPDRLDAELLGKAEEELDSLRGRPDLRSELRYGFWLTVEEAAGAREELQARCE